MDTESKKPTKSSGGVSNSPKSTTTRSRATTTRTRTSSGGAGAPLSAEEKLKKSLKSLSHTGGGGTGLKSSSTGGVKSTRSTSSKSGGGTKATDQRKKVGGVVLDVETIQDASKQKLHKSNRRNNVIILTLVILLIISLVYLAVAVIGYQKGKRAPNCHYKISGDVEASWIIENKTDTDFLLKYGLTTDRIYVLNSQLDIKTTEEVELAIEIIVLLKGKRIDIAGLDDKNDYLIPVQNDSNKFIYGKPIVENETIYLFRGIDFSNAPASLTSENIDIEVIAHINKKGT